MNLNKIKIKILNYFPKKIVLGLSGGPDSVFLFHILKKLHVANKLELVCVHLNHGWREEAIKDELFCKTLCEKYNIKLITEHAKNLPNIKHNGSKEEVGRKLRRNFFEFILKQENANLIALAHHADDQQETFFIRLLRGTTLNGLTCMKEIDGHYIRPLLDTKKQNILDYLHYNNLNYVIDESNNSEKFLRNRIRKNILPTIKASDNRFDKKFSDTLKHLQEEELFLVKLTEQYFDTIFSDNKGNIKTFNSLDPIIQRRVLIKWLCNEGVSFIPSSSYLEELIRFISSERGGSHIIHTDWKISKKQNWFWLSNP